MPITFGSFTGKRGLGASGGGEEEEILIQPTTAKMILVAGGGSAGPAAPDEGYIPHSWYFMWNPPAQNTSTFQPHGGYFEDIANGYDNSAYAPTWTTASGSYTNIYPGSWRGGQGSGGGGAGEVKYSNIANLYSDVTYTVTIGTGGTYSDQPAGLYYGEAGNNSTLTAPSPGVPGGLTVTASGGGGGGGGGFHPNFYNYNNYVAGTPTPIAIKSGSTYHREGQNGGCGGGGGGGLVDFANSNAVFGYTRGTFIRRGGQATAADTNQPSTGLFIGVGGYGGAGYNALPSLTSGGGGGASGKGANTSDPEDPEFGSGRSIYTPIELGPSMPSQLANTAYISNVWYNLGFHGNGTSTSMQHYNGTGSARNYPAYSVLSCDGVHGTAQFPHTTPSTVPAGLHAPTPYLYAGLEPGHGGDGFSINWCLQYYSTTPGNAWGTDIEWGGPPGIVSGSGGINTDEGRMMPAVSPSNAPYFPGPIGPHGYMYGYIAGGGGGVPERVNSPAKSWLSSPTYGLWAHSPSNPAANFTKGSSPSHADEGWGNRSGVISNSNKIPGSGGSHDTGDGIPNGGGADGVFIMQHSAANAVATCTGDPIIFKADGNVYYIFKSSGTFNWANTIPE